MSTKYNVRTPARIVARKVSHRVLTGVAEREWIYRCTFVHPTASDEVQASRALVQIRFEGLDTICDIYLVRMPEVVLISYLRVLYIEWVQDCRGRQYVPFLSSQCQLW